MTIPLAASWRLGSNVPAIAGRAPTAIVRLAPPERKRWRRPVLWLSAVIHLAIVLAFLISSQPKPPDDDTGPPSVSVMFAPTADTATNTAPTPQASTGTPDAAVPQRDATPAIARGDTAPAMASSTEPPAPLPAIPPSAVPAPAAPPPVAFAPPAPPTASFSPPAPAVAALPPQSAPPVPTSPAPATPAPTTPEDQAALPIPPVPPAIVPPAPTAPPMQQAMLQPLLRPTPQQAERVPEQPPRRPAAARPPAPRRSTAPDGFPMPTFSSLGGALANSARPSREPSREMPGPVRVSSSNAFRPQFDLSGDDLGPDWNRQIRDWIERHKYYPQEAAMAGEEGVAAVRVTLGRDGHVRTVNLLQRSGSQWLDLALQALFRSQNLPPIPDTIHDDQATINIQMHYILIRQ